MLQLPLVCQVICLALLAFNLARASTPLVDIDPAVDVSETNGAAPFWGFAEPNINGMYGWSFYVHQPVKVTHVAWYDEAGDGLSHPRMIGLWRDVTGKDEWPYIGNNSPEQVLFHQEHFQGFPQFPFEVPGVEIPAGAAAELDGVWRKTPLPLGPIVLSPGGYDLGGLGSEQSLDDVIYVRDGGLPALPADSRITIGAPWYQPGPFGSRGGFLLVEGVELGPMLFVVPVPEPSGLALASVGLFFASRCRRQPARSLA